VYDVVEVDDEDIVSIADLKPVSRCPKCKSTRLVGSAIPETSSSFIGAALYALTQTCIMCRWSRTSENVKLGV
jgi:hypothetical protein